MGQDPVGSILSSSEMGNGWSRLTHGVRTSRVQSLKLSGVDLNYQTGGYFNSVSGIVKHTQLYSHTAFSLFF